MMQLYWKGTAGAPTELPPCDPDPEGEPRESKLSMWAGWDGLTVTTCGIVLPALTLAVCGTLYAEAIYRLILKLPMQTLAECLFALLVPIANYMAWSAVRVRRMRNPIRIGVMNGMAVGASAITGGITVAASVAQHLRFGPESGSSDLYHFMLAAVAAGALAASAYLAHRLRLLRETQSSRMRSLVYSACGVVLSLLAFGMAETRPFLVRAAEHAAVTDSQQRHSAIDFLRSLGPEHEMRLQCADPRAAGIAGLFFPVDPHSERQLYFAVTGTPYRFDDSTSLSTLSDDFLRRNAVGERMPGLALVRSQMTGSVHPTTLSATLHWTFVFKNSSYTTSEARAELALPPGAALTSATYWLNGQPREAKFGATRVSLAGGHTDLRATDPVLVTDLGRGRILLRCGPVRPQSEVKVRVSLATPLEPTSASQSALTLPRLISTNFALSQGEHALKLKSPERLESNVKAARLNRSSAGHHLVTADLTDADLNSAKLSVMATRQPSLGSLAVPDTFSRTPAWIVATMTERQPSPPKHLVVVVDGSAAIAAHAKEIAAALERLPRDMKCTVLVASDRDPKESDSLSKGLKALKTARYEGGQDNLRFVIKAAELAGETEGGAVLWIHGPQHEGNEEIFITSPFDSTPVFYEYAVDNGWVDADQYFKNHREIGPFNIVYQFDSTRSDLDRFLAHWRPGGKEFAVELARTTTRPACPIASGVAPTELASLYAYRKTNELLAQRKMQEAALVAVTYKVVSPVSCAAVMEGHQGDPQSGVAATGFGGDAFSAVGTGTAQVQPFRHGGALGTTAAIGGAMVQGATNGTIGPQAADFTVVQGINTAGTVRVNNIANLEALLNLFANFGEVVVLGYGVYNVVLGLASRNMAIPLRLGPAARISFGITAALVGLCIPGCVNWLVASARDANLFS